MTNQTEHPFAEYVRILGKGKKGSRSFTQEEAYKAFSMILQGQVEDVQLGAFLMLLRVKEETAEEIAGFAAAVRDNMIKADTMPQADLDWSSYAGKKSHLPWYILSSLLIAQNGTRVFMHGAAGHTANRVYTEQVLRELNIATCDDWKQVATELDTTSFAYLPLANFCPTLQRLIDLRNSFGLRSPVHTLTRLINPLDAEYSIQSIFHPAYRSIHTEASAILKYPNLAVFKGEGGEIERKPDARCLVETIIDHEVGEEKWPQLLTDRQAKEESLDITRLKAIWNKEESIAPDSYAQLAIITTTAVALRLLKKAETQESAMKLAEEYWQQRKPI